jgi:lipopolysaccharide transport system ATP-binding protein
MGTKPAIEIKGLGKAFDVQSGPARRLWKAVSNGQGNGDAGFWALQDFDLTAMRGESIGIVGLNGSGKSTLLQLICGTLLPNTGSISADGRIVAMLELGAGFNPDFTGRENAHLSGFAYGLEGAMGPKRMERIEAFADIGDYFDRPVREYSSGMYVRLAFAVCANVDADILLVDEVLSVGDVVFQKKCRRFIREFLETGTVLFVSHDPYLVRSVCNRAILLENGRKTAEGTADSIIRLYSGSAKENGQSPSSRVAKSGNGQEPDKSPAQGFDPYWGTSNQVHVAEFDVDALRHGFGGCKITSCYFSVDGHSSTQTLCGGQQVSLHIEARADREISQAIFGFIFRNEKGQNLFGDNTFSMFREDPVNLKQGEVVTANFSFQFPYLPVGNYWFSPSIIQGTQQDHRQLDWLEDALKLTVIQSGIRDGLVGIRHFDIQLISQEPLSRELS